MIPNSVSVLQKDSLLLVERYKIILIRQIAVVYTVLLSFVVKVSNQFIGSSIRNSFRRFYKHGSRFSFFLNTGEKVGSFHYLLLPYGDIL